MSRMVTEQFDKLRVTLAKVRATPTLMDATQRHD